MSTRFARMVEMVTRTRPSDTDPDMMASYICVDDAAKLLQREHAAVVRRVKKMQSEINGPTFDYDNGYGRACFDLLTWLHGRGR